MCPNKKKARRLIFVFSSEEEFSLLLYICGFSGERRPQVISAAICSFPVLIANPLLWFKEL